ncbi:MAG: hypothetical protein ACFFC7_28055 [Candidatus Hermodarchaeota archaeon]
MNAFLGPKQIILNLFFNNTDMDGGFFSSDSPFGFLSDFLSIGEDITGTIGLVLALAFILTTVLFFWYLFAWLRCDKEEQKTVLVKKLTFSLLIGAGILILGPYLMEFLSTRLSFI